MKIIIIMMEITMTVQMKNKIFIYNQIIILNLTGIWEIKKLYIII